MVPRIKGHIEGFWKYKSSCSAKVYHLKISFKTCLALLGVFGLGWLGDFFSRKYFIIATMSFFFFFSSTRQSYCSLYMS